MSFQGGYSKDEAICIDDDSDGDGDASASHLAPASAGIPTKEESPVSPIRTFPEQDTVVEDSGVLEDWEAISSSEKDTASPPKDDSLGQIIE
jgi:hypothetical protein